MTELVKCKECGKETAKDIATDAYNDVGRALCQECWNKEVAAREKPQYIQPVLDEKEYTEIREPTIVPTSGGLVTPVASIDEIVQNWQAYQQLKTKILDKSDIANIQGNDHIKKSGFRKLATAYCISDEILEKHRVQIDDENFLWEVEVRAVAPNGRQAIGVAICDSREEGKLYDKRGKKLMNAEHVVFSTAHTRAKSRAISDLIGAGEVSAEELQ